MPPGLVVLLEPGIIFIVYVHLLSREQPAVLSYRADLDAEAAWRDEFLAQFLSPYGARFFVSQLLRILLSR